MALVDKIFVSGVWVPSAVRFANSGGTPIVSAAESGTGELISDDYTLTVSAVGGGTCTITVTTSSPNNPYNGRVVTGVPIDGTTPTILVVPGVSIIFSAGSANGNTALVHGGVYLGVFDAAGVGAGVPSTGIQHKVTNTGTGSSSDSKATLITQAVQKKKTGTVFAYVRPYADGATEKVAGGGSVQTKPYALKVIAVSGSGPTKIGTLQVDGVTLDVDTILDLTTGTTVSGTGLKATGTNGYRIVDGPLTGVEFALSASVVTNDIANVLIFPSRFVQIAPDVTGSEGTYGTSDVPLTQSGQSAGVIQAAADAYYWVRVLVPVGGNAESNPYPANVTIQGSQTGSADWDG